MKKEDIKKSKRSCNGFTIIELIVVMGIMLILGLIFTQILTETLRGQNKVRVINQVKQNGQIALDKLSSSIRQGGEVQCVGDADSNAVDDTLVLFKPSGMVPNEGAFTRFRLHPPAATANGYLTEDVFNGNIVDYSANKTVLCSQAGNPANEISLTDTDPIKGVSLTYSATGTPVFRWMRKDGANDAVTISFRIFPGVKVGDAYEATVKEEGIPLFTTTVQLRSSW